MTVQFVSALVYWYLCAATGSIGPAVAHHALHNSLEILELQIAVLLLVVLALAILHRRRPRGRNEATASADRPAHLPGTAVKRSSR
jgi:membrane protein implicated in regulation of membrane protease activity